MDFGLVLGFTGFHLFTGVAGVLLEGLLGDDLLADRELQWRPRPHGERDESVVTISSRFAHFCCFFEKNSLIRSRMMTTHHLAVESAPITFFTKQKLINANLCRNFSIMISPKTNRIQKNFRMIFSFQFCRCDCWQSILTDVTNAKPIQQ